MGLRDRLQTALKEAMRAREADRLSTLRLINAAIKDRDIAARSDGRGDGRGDGLGDGLGADGVPDAEVLAILGKMVRQRLESVKLYEEGGRLELAEKELAEIRVIEEFLPRPLTPAEVEAAITAAIGDVGAAGIRDMGRVIAVLKARHTGQMDFGAVGAIVKARLG